MALFKYALSFLVSAVFICSTASAQSLPNDLNEGDMFRYIFVTSNETPALSTDVNFYNDFVNATAANNAALDMYSWNAIVSTETVDAIDNTNTNVGGDDVPIYLLDGNRIIGNNADLWGGVTLETGIDLDENLNLTNGFVWTGTISTGVDDDDFEVGSGNLVRYGFSGDTDSRWIFDNVSTGGTARNLYALSDPITFSTVPEPTSTAILAFGCFGYLVRRKRR